MDATHFEVVAFALTRTESVVDGKQMSQTMGMVSCTNDNSAHLDLGNTFSTEKFVLGLSQRNKALEEK